MQKNGLLIALVGSLLVAPVLAQTPFNVAEVRRSVVHVWRITPRIVDSRGSGFIVSADGLIYTNRHVVQPDDEQLDGSVIYVGVPNEQDSDDLDFFQAAMVYATDNDNPVDVAVLKITARADYGPFKPLAHAVDRPRLGDEAAVIGYPYVGVDQPVLSFNRGYISATRVPARGVAYYQTDAAVNRGNSGGPLLNGKGQVIGIVTRKNLYADNVGFALYMDAAMSLIAKQPIERLAKMAAPPEGPLTRAQLPRRKTITPERASWRVNDAKIREEPSYMILDNRGDQYWMTTLEPLPAEFQLDIACSVGFMRGRQEYTGGARSMCLRFGTSQTDAKILLTKGLHIRDSADGLAVFRDGKFVVVDRFGSADRRGISVTYQAGRLTFARGAEIVLEHQFDDPPDLAEHFSIGGFLSRMVLRKVIVKDLTEQNN